MKYNFIPFVLLLITAAFVSSITTVAALAEGEYDFSWRDSFMLDEKMNKASPEDYRPQVSDDKKFIFKTDDIPSHQQLKDPFTGEVIEDSYRLKMGDFDVRHTERRNPVTGELVEHSLSVEF